MTTSLNQKCPCGSGSAYEKCCGLYHAGQAAPSAEALMRSRYSAYVVGKIDYVGATNDPQTGTDFDAEAAEAWSKQSEWLGLEIIAANETEVEFKAKYRTDGREEIHHEVSLFRKDPKNGRWYYREGKTLREPERRTTPKLGRNDPCSCGSGQKFKKCCG